MKNPAKSFLMFLLYAAIAALIAHLILGYIHRNRVLNEVIARLLADTRTAEVLVTGVNYDETAKKTYTTIKFLEYDVKGMPLKPKYFTFAGNIIQFQSLVIRFDDARVMRGDKLQGKSAYLFWKVFMLDGADTQEFEITKLSEVPEGYRFETKKGAYEEKLWSKFWKYALDPKESDKLGVKNAQIEAPGVMFIPGMVYTIKIENDGGLRIDSTPIPTVLRGEKILE